MSELPPLWDRKSWIIRRLATECYERRDAPIFLSSGKMSNDYIDARKLSLSPDGIELIAREICWRLKDISVDAIGGPTVGADAIVSSTILYAKMIWEKSIWGFLTRQNEKEHGLGGRFVGRLPFMNAKIVLVDDVLTSGDSLKSSIDALNSLKAPTEVVKCLVLVDREEGGKEAIENLGIDVEAICTLQEIIQYAQENSK